MTVISYSIKIVSRSDAFWPLKLTFASIYTEFEVWLLIFFLFVNFFEFILLLL